jgi:molybdopterin-biosynthesis enzyme MoeA-like protein
MDVSLGKNALMKMEIIVLASEILDGTVVDEFSYWIGKHLGDEHIIPTRVVIIEEEDLKAEVISALSTKRFDVLIIVCEFKLLKSDKILNLISEVTGRRLLPDERILKTARKDFLENLGKETPVLPENADIIKNPKGASLGFKIATQHCAIYVLPKKVDELRMILKESVIPDFKKKLAS